MLPIPPLGSVLLAVAVSLLLVRKDDGMLGTPQDGKGIP